MTDRVPGPSRALLAALAGSVALAAAGLWLVARGDAQAGEPGRVVFDGLDADRPRIEVALRPLLDGLHRPVDVQVPPGSPGALVVVEQAGRLVWVEPGRNAAQVLAVRVEGLETGGGEQGLLGLAFHPDFARNGRFFLNTTERAGAGVVTRVTAWRGSPGAGFAAGPFTRERVLLEVPQPYANHNGGGLVFGPDARLYVGLGDGGSAGDPEGHGQRSDSLLGKMLRLDVDAASDGPAPRSVFARGLRNPWRFSFDPRGRLVVGDVGQNRFEEIDLVPEGANMGWNVREGRVCFRPESGCPETGFVGPVHVYGREDGVSVTGGVVYTGKAIPELRDRYVFGDYGSGRLWALRLPETAGAAAPTPDALGRFGLSVACIARDGQGELLVCDHIGGRIWRIERESTRP